MGDLDRRLPRVRVAVEREQAVAAERLDHRVHRLRLGERRELRPPHATPRVLRPLAEGDEAKEQLPARVAPGLVHRVEQLLRAPSERARDASDLPVRVERQRSPVGALRQLGERVLQQRERSGPVRDVGDHLREEPRFDDEAGLIGGRHDRAFELLRRHRRDRLGPGSEQVAEAGDRQRGVVEVGSKGCDDPNAAVGFERRRADGREEARPSPLVLDEREDLLELIEDDQQLGVPVGQDPVDRSHEPELVAFELLHQRGRRLDGDAHQGGLDLAERLVAGHHVDHVPALRTRDRTAPQRRHQPCADDRGLARARGTHHGEEPSRRVVLREAPEQPLGHRLAAEEVGGVRLQERAEPLVGVADVPDGFARRRRRALEGRPERRGELRNVGEAFVRILGGRACDRVVNGDGELRPEGADRGEGVARMVLEQGGQRRLGERVRPGEHLVRDDPERVDVRSRARRVEPDLLGRQVRGCSAHHRARRSLGGAGIERDAEVREVGVAVLVQQDVAGLHVPVDDPLTMRRRERRRDLLQHRRGARGFERARRPGVLRRSRPGGTA